MTRFFTFVSTMRAISFIFVALHVAALILGLFGMLVAIPHPELWVGNKEGEAFFALALSRDGATGLVLATIAMLAYGFYALGWRKTVIFFVCSFALSATAELVGTKTGFPFGGYEYTDFLGAKILGRVPYSVPLSWFYMGFASYILAAAFVGNRNPRANPLWAVLLGTWLLTTWDLVLDPAMASPAMRYIHFWIWHTQGPYFGMPLGNLVGWFGTGFVFIGVARLWWRTDLDPKGLPLDIPFIVYVVNILWAMVLSTSAGLWPSAVAAIVTSILPAVLARRSRSRGSVSSASY